MEILPPQRRPLKRDLRRAIIAHGCARYDGVSMGVGVWDGTSTVVRRRRGLGADHWHAGQNG